MPYYVYVLYSLDHDRLYVGQTEDLAARLGRHNRGHEESTRSFRPWQLIWFDEKHSRAEAMTLERKLKNLCRARMEAFMNKYSEGKLRAENYLSSI